MTRRPMIEADLRLLKWPSDPIPNPQGDSVAYLVRECSSNGDGYRTRVAVSRLGAPPGSIRYVADAVAGHPPSWSPDGCAIRFMRDGQVWEADLQSRREHPCVRHDRPLLAFAQSADGRRIAFTAETGHERDKHVFDGALPRDEGQGWADRTGIDLYVCDTSTPMSTTLVAHAVPGIHNLCWSPDGSSVAFLSKLARRPHPTAREPLKGSELVFVSLTTGKLKRLADDLHVSAFSFTDDGEHLICSANARDYDSATHTELYRTSIRTGCSILLSAGHDEQLGAFALTDTRPVSVPTAPIVAPDDSVLTLSSAEGTVTVRRLNTDGVLRTLTPPTYEVSQFAAVDQGRSLVLVAATASSPGEIYLAEPDSGTVTPLTALNADLVDTIEVAEPTEFWAPTSVPGVQGQQGWITTPRREDECKLPVVFLIHGGPHAMCTPAFSYEIQMLAAAGYAVVYANIVGSFGYGQDFAKACLGRVGELDVEEFLQLVTGLLDRFDFLDAERACVMGGSYGGFMTSYVVGHTDRFRAAVSERSISNWLSFYGTSDIGIAYAESQIGGSPWPNANDLWDRSPLAHVERIQTPLLLIHGEADRRCPVAQSEELYCALTRAGREAKLVIFPDVGHDLHRSGSPRLRTNRVRTIIGWLNAHISSCSPAIATEQATSTTNGSPNKGSTSTAPPPHSPPSSTVACGTNQTNLESLDHRAEPALRQ